MYFYIIDDNELLLENYKTFLKSKNTEYSSGDLEKLRGKVQELTYEKNID
jgi:hypothetical protein